MSAGTGITTAGVAAYKQIIERIFFTHFTPGLSEVHFNRSEIGDAADALGIDRPKNIGDVIYTFRYRDYLPTAVRSMAPAGRDWIIRSAGTSQYFFATVALAYITPTVGLTETKVPESTPGIITKYALGDEQALLAKVRYNRLIDIFTGVTCYALQSHLRTSVRGVGQVETDEIYVGVDRRGVHYVIPVQAKGGQDILSVVQIERDFAMCRVKFPSLVCRPIAAQFMTNDVIALFEFEEDTTTHEVLLAAERHYRLVAPEDITDTDLNLYQRRSI